MRRIGAQRRRPICRARERRIDVAPTATSGRGADHSRARRRAVRAASTSGAFDFTPGARRPFLASPATSFATRVIPLDAIASRHRPTARRLGRRHQRRRARAHAHRCALDARPCRSPRSILLARRLVAAATSLARTACQYVAWRSASAWARGACRPSFVIALVCRPSSCCGSTDISARWGSRARTRICRGARSHARAGYYDQAHLLHESNEIAGTTPAKLLGRDAALTEVFLSDRSALP